MKSDAALLNLVPSDLIDFQIEPSLFIRKVDVGNSEKTFLATTFAGYVFTTKFLSKNLQLKFTFSWDSVKRISSTNSQTISLFYHGGEFKFTCKDAPDMVQAIITNLKSIFTPSELPIFALDESIALVNQTLQFPMVSRFRFKARLFNRRVFPGILNALREFTLYARKLEEKKKYVEFDISQVPNYLNDADLILDALEIDPKIKNLVIPATGVKTFWAKVANYFRRNTTIQSIVCKDAITNDFQPFITALQENSNSGLNTFSFIDTGFEANAVHMVPDLLSAHRIDNLKIQNSMDAGLFQILVPMFEKTPAFNQLQTLCLDKSKGANPAPVLKYMQNLRRLECCNCDIDISDIFFKLAELPRAQLKDLCADGNLCVKELKFSMKFSKRITSISMKGCTWAKSNLCTLIQLLCKKKRQGKKTAVNFSNAKLEPEAWRRFFKKIGRVNFPNLACFLWNSNPLHQNVFKLLSTATDLETLSFSGCFDGADDNFNYFIDYLSKTTTLKKLVVAGTSSKKLRDAAQYIFEVLESLQISILDVSNNDIGDDLFPLLNHLITENPIVTDFYIDDNKFENVAAFENFIQQMKARGTRLGIEIPKNDLTMISVKNRSIRKARLSAIIQEIIAIGKFPKRRRGLQKKKLDANPPMTVRAPHKTAINPNQNQPMSAIGQIDVNAIKSLLPQPVSKMPQKQQKQDISVASIIKKDNDLFSDEYEYYYSDDEPGKNPDEETKDIEWSVVGECSWDNVQAFFQSDDYWMKHIESTPLPNKKDAVEQCNKEFSLENIISAIKC